MEYISELHLFQTSPLVKYFLLKNNRRKWVDKYFLSRNKKGEFGRSFEELRRNDEKFFEYTRMTQSTFDYILENIESHISKYSNFRECISAKHKLILTLR
uniref:Uncharacterized protein n=1 Tax=Photinus pyralis TaxID=7054 RepID=A0A1Y1LX18_PHOPY